MKSITLILFVFYSLNFSAMAEPSVLFDSGNTVPTLQYKKIIQGVDIPDFGALWAVKKSAEVNAVNQDPTDPGNWLPVTTNKLTPGYVKARKVRFNELLSPVCVIGSDDKSINWLKKYQSILLENNVLCWLVQAENINDVQRVIAALAGVSMSPADGDAIADFFTISHYPVLITQRFIEQ